MTPAKRLRGIVPPLVTPLSGPDALDRGGLSRVIDRVVAGGAAGVFILGSTGEGPALSLRLRYDLVEVAAELLAGRAPLLVGVSDTALAESVRLAKHAGTCGAAAIVATPPYYFPRIERDHVRFFHALAEESPCPLYVYNIPACVGMTLSVAAVEQCAEHPHIIGLKDSAGDLEQFKRYLTVRARRPDWSIFIGPEQLLADAVLLGGDGGVHAGANVVPRLFVDWFAAAERRDLAEVALLRERVVKLGCIYEIGGDFLSVARGTKCALSVLGICTDEVSPPARPYDREQRDRLTNGIRELFPALASTRG